MILQERPFLLSKIHQMCISSLECNVNIVDNEKVCPKLVLLGKIILEIYEEGLGVRLLNTCLTFGLY